MQKTGVMTAKVIDYTIFFHGATWRSQLDSSLASLQSDLPSQMARDAMQLLPVASDLP
jgi:hypothetical protein